jgi:hypothetical protein
MTYQPSLNAESIAGVRGVAFCEPTYNVSTNVGDVLSWASVTSVQGSSFATISAGQIVLEAGYQYYLEGTAQGYTSTLDASDFLEYQWHDGSQFVGFASHLGAYRYSASASEVGDEKALAFIDTTSGAVTVSLKMLAKGGDINVANSTDAHSIYAGYGRAIIIQLEAP